MHYLCIIFSICYTSKVQGVVLRKEQSLQETRKVLFIILVLNWLIATVKVIVGVMSNSTAVLSNGLESYADGASNIVGIIALKFCLEPVDEDHPYGHGKFETFATALIGCLLLVAGYKIFRESVSKILNYIFNGVVPEVSFEPILIIILSLTLLANVFIVLYELKKGKELKSSLLIADAQHTKTDLVATSVVIVSCFLTNVFHMIDPILSLVISLYIFKTAYEIFSDISQVFSDKSRVEKEFIEQQIKNYPEIIDAHNIRSRGMSNQIFLDFHLNMNKDLTLCEAHSITEQLEKDIFESNEDIIDITIHMEPK